MLHNKQPQNLRASYWHLVYTHKYACLPKVVWSQLGSSGPSWILGQVTFRSVSVCLYARSQAERAAVIWDMLLLRQKEGAPGGLAGTLSYLLYGLYSQSWCHLHWPKKVTRSRPKTLRVREDASPQAVWGVKWIPVQWSNVPHKPLQLCFYYAIWLKHLYSPQTHS